MKMTEERDRLLLRGCEMTAMMSRDPSTQTGAIITGPDGIMLGSGYNRFPFGMAQTEERMANRADKLSRIVHCEIDALVKAGRLGPGCSLYTTPFMPCDRCVVIMLHAGIKRFVTYKASPEKLVRWGEVFNLVRDYIDECGGTLIEYETPDN